MNIDGCHVLSDCINTVGSFYCQCHDGYEFEDDTNSTCINIDECVVTPPCDINANCTDTVGSFDCECNDGYSGNGTFCEDFDECTHDTDGCDINAWCNNTIGSFDCYCNIGYEFVNGSDICSDINECLDSNATDHSCSYVPEGICTNTEGSYECSCPQGMGGNGTKVDPCYETITCDANEVIDKCANLNCYTTCETYLNYQNDSCPVSNQTRALALQLLSYDEDLEDGIISLEQYEHKKFLLFEEPNEKDEDDFDEIEYDDEEEEEDSVGFFDVLGSMQD